MVKIKLGDRVYSRIDPKHIGTVVDITENRATVKWEKTGWLSSVILGELELENALGQILPVQPRTFAATQAEFEEKVIREAKLFRIVRYYRSATQHRGSEIAESADFAQALFTAQAIRDGEFKFEGTTTTGLLLYAVDEQGRFTVIPKEKWDDYYNQVLNKEAVSAS